MFHRFIKIQAVLLIVVVTIMMASGNHDDATAGSDKEQQVIDPLIQSRQSNEGPKYFFLLMDSIYVALYFFHAGAPCSSYKDCSCDSLTLPLPTCWKGKCECSAY